MKYPMKYDIFGGMSIRRNPSYEQVTRGDEARFFLTVFAKASETPCD